MKLAKRTYALPHKTIEQFEITVDSGRRSGVIAELISNYLENRKREALRADIEQGCRDMWDLYRDINKEWEPTDDALHRAIEY